jgi:CheY-like chemotaxis protein
MKPTAIIRIPAKTRCLVVEDNAVRLTWFLVKLPNCTVAESPQEAVMTLDTSEPFDIVFLDHDCDGKFFADPTDPEYLNKSFWRVARWLRHIQYNGRVVIHSGNPVGAERMAALLGATASVHVLPFSSFDIEILD